jgi:hypothetical protein
MTDFPHCSPAAQQIMARWEREQEELYARLAQERAAAAERLSGRAPAAETLLERQLRRRLRLEMGARASRSVCDTRIAYRYHR